ncbi:MAG: hypothetical protein MZW92_01795 [Comamonadaceae bacterium]|nr:hypothetical protein [Comamonadaceae bacterium]
MIELPRRLPVPAASARARRCARCPAASATGCCWRGCSRGRPTCWCSTSRPTTSTSRRWSCWRNCCRTTPARVFLVSHDRALPRQRRHRRSLACRGRRPAGASTPAATRTGSGARPSREATAAARAVRQLRRRRRLRACGSAAKQRLSYKEQPGAGRPAGAHRGAGGGA